MGTPAHAEPFPVGPEPTSPTPPAVEVDLGPGGQSWRVAVGLSGNLVTHSSAMALLGGAGLEIYLDPLVDHPRVPLGLLLFAEHPDTLSVALGNTINGFAGSAGAIVYPWQEVGVSASLSGEDDPGQNKGQVGAGVAVEKYFRSDLKGTLGYVGSRLWEPTQYASADGARATLSWLWRAVMLSAEVDAAFQEQQAQGLPTFAPPSAVGSLVRGFSLSASYYLGRRWTLSVFGGASLTTFDQQSASAASESFGASAEVYLTPSFYLIGGVQPVLHQFSHVGFTPTATFAQTAPSLQTFWLSATYRL